MGLGRRKEAPPGHVSLGKVRQLGVKRFITFEARTMDQKRVNAHKAIVNQGGKNV